MKFWWRKPAPTPEVQVEDFHQNQVVDWWRRMHDWCTKTGLHYDCTADCPPDYRCQCKICQDTERVKWAHNHRINCITCTTSTTTPFWHHI